MLVTTVAVLAVALAGYFIFVPLKRSRNQVPGFEQSALWSADVQQIASNFYCPCGQCGEERLDQCDCEIPGGAIEARRYIRKLLDENLPQEQIMRRFEERYGNKV